MTSAVLTNICDGMATITINGRAVGMVQRQRYRTHYPNGRESGSQFLWRVTPGWGLDGHPTRREAVAEFVAEWERRSR